MAETTTSTTPIDTETAAIAGNVPLPGPAILANARAIAPILREEAEAGERQHHLTARTIKALRSTGVFRMSMPREWGGPELGLDTQLEIIETLSHADGSAGWCAMIGSDSGFFSSYLEDKAARRLYADLDAITAGWVAPIGRLQETDGGYRLTGRWSFASGCTHADVILGGAFVFRDGDMVIGADDRPEYRIALLPATQVEIIDNWDTAGLCATGSHDYRIEDTFVPAEHTFQFRDIRRDGALYAWPGTFLMNGPGVALGIGRAALEAAEEIVADKVLLPEQQPARHEARVQTAIAQAHSLVGSARSYALDVVGDSWSTLQAGDEPSLRQRAAFGGCIPHTVRSCLEAVRLLVDAVGSASIRRSCPLDRQLRDLTTMAQHIAGQTRTSGLAGSLWLDAPADHPFIVDHLL